jgi:methylmalonyl-CoA mutase
VVLPSEIAELMGMEFSHLQSDDGRSMGLQGMINDLVKRCDTDVPA